ncbi:hypothetical protein, partial [Rhizobium sp. HT1-10]|uniref:hypothetical protein n=1 Tax=Rhizobium sp. HT1-10 TaxID=3111638 RepID=UPI003C23AA03
PRFSFFSIFNCQKTDTGPKTQSKPYRRDNRLSANHPNKVCSFIRNTRAKSFVSARSAAVFVSERLIGPHPRNSQQGIFQKSEKFRKLLICIHIFELCETAVTKVAVFKQSPVRRFEAEG